MNIVSFGGGVNSAAMLVGMYQRGIPIDLILFADVGAERPEIYAFLHEMGDWLRVRDLPPITVVENVDRFGQRLTLEQECLRSHTLPSIAFGHKRCSLKHKIAPQDKFCNHHPGCRAEWAEGRCVKKYIGYDAGEGRRQERARGGIQSSAHRSPSHARAWTTVRANSRGCRSCSRRRGSIKSHGGCRGGP